MAMTKAHGDKSHGLTYKECGGRESATTVSDGQARPNGQGPDKDGRK